MSEPTKKKMLEWLGDDDSGYKAWNHLWSKDFNDANRKIIRRLIENMDKKVRVNRKFIGKIQNILLDVAMGNLGVVLAMAEIEGMLINLGYETGEKGGHR